MFFSGRFITQHLAISAAHCFGCKPWMPPEAPCLCLSNHPENCPPGSHRPGEGQDGQDGWTLAFVDTAPESWRVERTTVEPQ